MGNNRKPNTQKGLKHSRRLTPPAQLCGWQDFFQSVAEEDCRFAAGYRNDTSSNNVGENGNYWSSTLSSSNSNNAQNLNFNSSNHNTNNNNRRNGQSVRPVTALTRIQLLADLYKAYRCARLHKRSRRYQLRFEMNLEENLNNLCDELINRTYQPGTCSTFIVYEPKQREVFAAPFRDRIVHHLYYNYTHQLFERTFIADTYSCIKKRGTHYGVNRLEHHIRSVSQNYTRECYVMKLDIKGYFMSINRQRLLDIATEILNSQRHHRIGSQGETWDEVLNYDLILYLTRVIILHNPIKNCIRRGNATDWNGLPSSKSLFFSKEGCGLPIGNLTSQLFSNVYLNCLDQYVKRVLKCVHYGRYVDDMYFVDTSKQHLRQMCDGVNQFLQQHLQLSLHPDKIQMFSVHQGVEFLGQYVMPHRRYISNHSKRRINQGMAILAAKKEIETLRLQASVNSYAGILGHVRGYRYWAATILQNSWLFRFGVFRKGWGNLINRNMGEFLHVSYNSV